MQYIAPNQLVPICSYYVTLGKITPVCYVIVYAQVSTSEHFKKE